MKHRLIQAAEDSFAFAAGLVHRHPKQLTLVLTALLLGGTGATYAVASLAPDAADLPVHTVVEDVTPLQVFASADAVSDQPLSLFRSDTSRSNDTAEAQAPGRLRSARCCFFAC